MNWSNTKYDKTIKSNYKYVFAKVDTTNGNIYWFGQKRKTKTTGSSTKMFDTEREAALWVDKQLIQMGFEPVNILKRL